jgi:hypothetical protein
MFSSFVILGLYIIWYFFEAKTYHSLNLDELAPMWKTHKQQTGCKSTNSQALLMKNNEVVGYKCSCGKNYCQKRLITQRAHKFTKKKLIPTMKTDSQAVMTLKIQ